jgi:hypothetical protein
VTRTHTAVIIAAFVLLSGSACGVARLAGVQATPRKPVSPTFTRAATFTPVPTLTSTSSPTSTDTPTITPSPTATPTTAPSDTPLPAATATAKPKPVHPAAPTATTAAPDATPTVAFDFVVAKQDVMPVIENGGCTGRHNIFVTVVDANGAPIDGLVVSDKDDKVSFVTGDKGPGQVTFDLWKNGYDLYIKGDSSGKPIRSQTTRHLSSDKPEISDMIKGGVCKDEAECQAKIAKFSYCFGHYAYEVTFKRTY